MKKLFKFLPITLLGFCLVLNSCSSENSSDDTLNQKSVQSDNVILSDGNVDFEFDGDYNDPYFLYSLSNSYIRLDESVGSLMVSEESDGSVSVRSDNLPFVIHLENGDSNSEVIYLNYSSNLNIEPKQLKISNSGFYNSSDLLNSIKGIGQVNL